VVLYLRFVKGWKLADMMYVTKGALVNMQESVNQSELWKGAGKGAGSRVEALQAMEVLSLQLSLQQPTQPSTASLTTPPPRSLAPTHPKGLANVRTQVEAATADLVARLHAVGDKADHLMDKQEEMDEKLDDVSERVEAVQGGVAVLHQQVAYSNHAITLLCGALSEVAKRVGLSNGRYVRALDGFVHGAPPPRLEGGAAPMLPVRCMETQAGRGGGAGQLCRCSTTLLFIFHLAYRTPRLPHPSHRANQPTTQCRLLRTWCCWRVPPSRSLTAALHAPTRLCLPSTVMQGAAEQPRQWQLGQHPGVGVACRRRQLLAAQASVALSTTSSSSSRSGGAVCLIWLGHRLAPTTPPSACKPKLMH